MVLAHDSQTRVIYNVCIAWPIFWLLFTCNLRPMPSLACFLQGFESMNFLQPPSPTAIDVRHCFKKSLPENALACRKIPGLRPPANVSAQAQKTVTTTLVSSTRNSQLRARTVLFTMKMKHFHLFFLLDWGGSLAAMAGWQGSAGQGANVVSTRAVGPTNKEL